MPQTSRSLSLTVIGLGQMGGNMALTLKAAGFAVTGTDVFDAARTKLASLGLNVVTPDALPASDVYLLSLPTSAHVREVLETSPGLLARAPRGSVIVDTSTSDPAMSRELAEKVMAAGLHWLDAPVSGGPKGAASGKLGMLLGGDETTIERVRPMLEAMSAKCTHVGGPGSGHVVKLANNYLCAAHLITTAEAVAMAAQAGVDPAACLAGINSGSGRSAISEVNFPEWVLSERFDSGFTTGLMRKDLRLAREAAEQLGLPLPLLQMVVDAWHDNTEQPTDSDDFNHITTPILARASQAEGNQ
ncbi:MULTISPECIES: NAD(P)-dependent oxidoreductase [Halomonadaceae]|jgi:3-hydroxyisobutyrate dehydrogenase|uniref:NAD(P)-dependent oxidoreductase n=1 Tax=Vreelandella piezotolerans TaxID=2609667 RepID=A0ABQ6X7F7_9GAMM|nr:MULTISPECIES: NAD(P)-dependent oxidoreductase [Halomonas]KAE8437934.1 NAD(P)-dependent oxidoreductase [Halomonas piezotolerans]QJA25739.1 NAD(P)-dependent oxidoreductase [Halomonas piezotolerans]TNH18912.1 NAD(P)-dependent oxidoreductase [Halomonas sp. BL6]